MRYLRTNTATRITVGPFLDKTDGITPEVSLTVTSEKLTLMVDDGGVPTLVLDAAPTASGGNNDMVHVTNDDAGFYDLELAAANVNYLGRAMLALTDVATHCPVFHEFMILPANVYDSLILGSGVDLLDVSAAQLAGTACTGRDIGASVLLSAGSGAGQLDFTSGVVKANLAQILGTALTETAGLIAAGFKKFFNVATPTGTVNSLPDAVPDAAGGLPVTGTRLTAIPWNAAWDAEVESEVDDALGAGTGTALTAIPWNAAWDAEVESEVEDAVGADVTTILGRVIGTIAAGTHNPQTGDSFARLGAPAGVSVSADIAAIEAQTDDIGAAGAGLTALATQVSVDGITAAVITNAAGVDVAADIIAVKAETAELKAAVITNAAGVDIAADIAAIQAKTVNLPADPADASDIAAAIAALNDVSAAEVNAEVVDALATDTYAEPTGVPGATVALATKIGYLFMALRNRLDVVADAKTFYDDGGATEWKKALSDDGTTYSEAEGAAP